MARLQKKYTDIIYIYSCISSSGVHSFSLSPSQANTCIMHTGFLLWWVFTVSFDGLFWWLSTLSLDVYFLYNFSLCNLRRPLLLSLSLTHTHTCVVPCGVVGWHVLRVRAVMRMWCVAMSCECMLSCDVAFDAMRHRQVINESTTQVVPWWLQSRSHLLQW